MTTSSLSPETPRVDVYIYVEPEDPRKDLVEALSEGIKVPDSKFVVTPRADGSLMVFVEQSTRMVSTPVPVSDFESDLNERDDIIKALVYALGGSISFTASEVYLASQRDLMLSSTGDYGTPRLELKVTD